MVPKQDAGGQQAHLGVGQVLADAIARAVAEGLEGVAVVVAEGFAVQRMGSRKPALGEELGSSVEVLGVLEGGPGVDVDGDLRGLVDVE